MWDGTRRHWTHTSAHRNIYSNHNFICRNSWKSNQTTIIQKLFQNKGSRNMTERQFDQVKAHLKGVVSAAWWGHFLVMAGMKSLEVMFSSFPGFWGVIKDDRESGRKRTSPDRKGWCQRTRVWFLCNNQLYLLEREKKNILNRKHFTQVKSVLLLSLTSFQRDGDMSSSHVCLTDWTVVTSGIIH